MKKTYLFLLSLVFAMPVFGAVVTDIQFVLPPFTSWFDAAPVPQLNIANGNSSVIAADVKINADATYDYQLKNASFQFAPSMRTVDVYPAGIPFAMAQFAGGSNLVVTGELWKKGGAAALFSGTVLEAQVSDASFTLMELAGNNVTTTADINMAVTGGELATGAASGFVMLDFTLSFLFNASVDPDTGMGVSNFTSSDYETGVSGAIVQIDAPLPEPATLAVLGLGCLMIRKFRT